MLWCVKKCACVVGSLELKVVMVSGVVRVSVRSVNWCAVIRLVANLNVEHVCGLGSAVSDLQFHVHIDVGNNAGCEHADKLARRLLKHWSLERELGGVGVVAEV